ncbi:protein YgfX [Microbulbifer taiwanensis]|uniref:Protein YgfX n=1 Tax=Microbulbifer taiwanensis TaxID=986746 RepID=A0ABW1YJD2_9GAMM|nr:protein YgfX [Microbulbifer taiwanensis]
MTTQASRSSYPQFLERSARLTCAVAPSRLLFILLLLIALQALSLLWWCRLPLYLFLPAVLLVLIYAAFEWRRLHAVRGWLGTRERRWFWQAADGEQREFEFQGELVLWRWLLVINGRDLQGRRLRMVLARDSVGRDDWRRLQAALRYSR